MMDEMILIESMQVLTAQIGQERLRLLALKVDAQVKKDDIKEATPTGRLAAIEKHSRAEELVTESIMVLKRLEKKWQEYHDELTRSKMRILSHAKTGGVMIVMVVNGKSYTRHLVPKEDGYYGYSIFETKERKAIRYAPLSLYRHLKAA